MVFNERLQYIRKERKLSQEELAEKLGISRQAVAKWEMGKTFPDMNNLIAMSELLGVTIDYLVKRDSECSSKNLSNKVSCREELISFLNLAIKNTYASNGKESKEISIPGEHHFTFKEGNYSYYDAYVGGEKFSGRVVVCEGNQVIWTMNYFGRTLEETFSIDFLKEALRHTPIQFPARGPSVYIQGESIYHNVVEGNMSWFSGKEEIYVNDTKAYECMYQGGNIR